MFSFQGQLKNLYPGDGNASLLFLVTHQGKDWLLKVARPGTDRLGSMYGREWLFHRIAVEMGLPAPAMAAVHINPADLGTQGRAPELRDLRRTVFPATPLLNLARKVTWKDLSVGEVARLALWNAATSIDAGDRIRDEGPRDFFLCTDAAIPQVMLDFEGLPGVFDCVVQGGTIECPTAIPVCLPPLPECAIEEAALAANRAIDVAFGPKEMETTREFWSGDLTPLLPVLKARANAAADLLIESARTSNLETR